MTGQRLRSAAIVSLFILSGAAGLIYEVVWARQLVLVFGNTTQAVSAILTGFFGGMALGSAIGGRLADRVRSPLRLYGIAEIVLVVVVVITPVTFRLIDDAYQGFYTTLEGQPTLLALVRFALALLALAPATILMGLTLPALTKELTRPPAHLSSAFGRLYAANTLGAIAGTLAAGLVLIELLGLSGALLVGAACSGLAGLAALGLARTAPSVKDQGPFVAPVPKKREADPSALSTDLRRRIALALAVAFASGLVSLGYQVLWTRLLAAGSGNSTYVFTLILAVFLAGIAIGAVLFTLVRPRLKDPVAFLAGAQVVVALIVLLGLVGVISRPPFVDPGRPLEALGLLWQSVVLVVLPATIVMGVSFPAASAVLPSEAGHAGRETGALLATNTLGAITGSFIVPFVVVPAFGSIGALVALIVTNLLVAVGLIAVAVRGRRTQMRLAVLAGATATALVFALVRPGAVMDPTMARIAYVGGEVYASAEDEIAAVQAGSVGITPQLWVTGTSMTVLTIDANLMPILPLIARPDATDAAVVAFGMGSSYRTALVAGLRTEAVELVPSVPRMFGWFHADAAAVLAHPDGRVVIADGRNHLELTERRYDIIVTDPPPPIESSGASVISSLEYYRVGRDRLKPGGIMMQWAPYGPGGEDLAAHIRTFRRVFEHVTVLRGPGGHGIFMLGSEDSITFEDAAIREVIGRPGVLENLSEPFDSPADTVDAWVRLIPTYVRWVDDEIDAQVGDGPVVTDDRPYSEYFLLRRVFDIGR